MLGGDITARELSEELGVKDLTLRRWADEYREMGKVGVVPSRNMNEKGNPQRVNYEIDFVCNRDSQRYYVQSAFSLPAKEKLDQEQTSLIKVDDFFKRVIVAKEDEAPHYNFAGILMLNVYDFLLDANVLEQ